MKTITDAWNDYGGRVLPPDAGPIQKAETETAFYAGSMLTLLIVANKIRELSESKNPVISGQYLMDYLETLNGECERYALGRLQPRPGTRAS